MLKITEFSNTILRDIDFHLNEGENLTILGSNGAGKSTLAKILCGISYSQAVELFGKKLHHFSAKERSEFINYVPPKLEMFDEYLSLGEYLELSSLYSKLTIDHVLELLELKALQHKPCITLSSGEQQLAMIASSLLHNAKLTIFDEPTANLDPKKSLKVAKILSGEKIQNRIIITHDLNLAHKLGYKIIYMLDGKIEFFDTNKRFFEVCNMDKFFGTSIKRIDDYFVVNL
ncbi:ATP-binding cassette domain-containing protein [Sulfurimonas crateris]|uniref:ATP-binding cassette domain-containing protein n=1 Tax=Sulfurimonas crateris TaxID=2574727 RepID=A0A4U2Z9H1_9BACT|nr:ATP-binding cassette domain-containing protein [Sulfurimonas crateris]TKI70968.1 ATP-binding cassette domain-containing protein [Sulfurimonas crateris]